MRNTAQDHPEGGRTLALARAGMDDDQALLAFLRGHDLVARGLLLGHLHGMARRVVSHGFRRPGRFWVCHGPFHCLTRGRLLPQVGPRWFLSYRQAKRECDRGNATERPMIPNRSRPRDRDRRGHPNHWQNAGKGDG
jgi:hypothetical protein